MKSAMCSVFLLIAITGYAAENKDVVALIQRTTDALSSKDVKRISSLVGNMGAAMVPVLVKFFRTRP